MKTQNEFSTTSHAVKPPQKEDQSLTSWIYCMTTYLAVLVAAGELLPDHLA